MNKHILTWEESRKRLEKAGIAPSAWQNFAAACREQGVNLHSALLATDREILAELYLEESGPDPLHRMFSVSKSLTALAIGCLAAEGKLSLDDPLLTFYPEYRAEAAPWLKEMTIRQMLKMESCHSKTSYKYDFSKPWLESFFTIPPDHAPGTIFRYDTSASHTLAHLAERLAGQELLDYLRDKGLRERGFSEEAYFMKDPQGHPIGGSGLVARTRDIALIAQLLMQGGGGVFPEDFCREMTSWQSDTRAEMSIPEEGYGYGFQCWRHRAGWAFYGMGGQIAAAVPEKNLLLVTTADLMKSKVYDQRLYDLFFELLVEQKPAPFPQDPAEAPFLRLQKLETLAPVSLPSPLHLTAENAGGLAELIYNENEEGCIRLRKKAESLEILFSLREMIEQKLGRRRQRAFVSAAASAGQQLLIRAQLIDEEVGFIEITVGFSERFCSMHIKNNIDPAFSYADGLWTFLLEV